MKACADVAVGETGKSAESGSVIAVVTVAEDGRAQVAFDPASTLKNRRVHDCLRDAVGRFAFAKERPAPSRFALRYDVRGELDGKTYRCTGQTAL